MSESTPSNDDPHFDPDPLADMEFELPVPDALPPDEVQARLEEPTYYYVVAGEVEGGDTVLAGGAVTEPGVEKVWSESEALLRDDRRLTDEERRGLSAGQVQDTGATA